MDEYKDHILEDLLAVDEGLTAWECEYLEDMATLKSWGQTLTDNQKLKLIEIYDKHC